MYLWVSAFLEVTWELEVIHYTANIVLILLKMTKHTLTIFFSPRDNLAELGGSERSTIPAEFVSHDS